MSDDTIPDPEFATIKEAGAHLRICKRTVINRLDSGKLTAVKDGGRTLIHWASIRAIPPRPHSRKLSPAEKAARKKKAVQ